MELSDLFLLKLALSFIIGGSYISFSIWLAEKFGSKIGGLVVGLPTTALVSLIFIAWTQDSQAAVAAIPIMPVAMAVGVVFLAVFTFFYRYSEKLAFLAGMLSWFVLTLPLVLVNFRDLFMSLILAAVFFTIGISYLSRFPFKKLQKFSLTKKQFLFRAVFAGAIVVLAVFLGKVLGPVWGGLFASFPAAFISTMYLLTKEHGIDFASSVARSMPFGTIGNVVFVLGFYFLVPIIGFVSGLIFSYLLSILAAFIIYKTVLK